MKKTDDTTPPPPPAPADTVAAAKAAQRKGKAEVKAKAEVAAKVAKWGKNEAKLAKRQAALKEIRELLVKKYELKAEAAAAITAAIENILWGT